MNFGEGSTNITICSLLLPSCICSGQDGMHWLPQTHLVTGNNLKCALWAISLHFVFGMHFFFKLNTTMMTFKWRNNITHIRKLSKQWRMSFLRNCRIPVPSPPEQTKHSTLKTSPTTTLCSGNPGLYHTFQHLMSKLQHTQSLHWTVSVLYMRPSIARKL